MDNNEKVSNEQSNKCTKDELSVQIENACGCKGQKEKNECGCGDVCNCDGMTEEEEIEGYASVEAVCECNCLTNPLNVGEKSCDCECPQNFNIFD